MASVSSYPAIFVDGPEEKPVLFITEWVGWPAYVPWVWYGDDGKITQFIYKHAGAGHYKVAASYEIKPL